MAYQQMPGQDWLFQIFQKVDRDQSGAISINELQQALSNGTWQPFNVETVRLMIGMSDHDQNGTINFQEFQQLWKFVTDWQNTYRQFDRDNSGFIDQNEFKNALTSFGYRLSDSFFGLIMRKFDRQGRGSIAFDDFIQACITLQTLTGAFRYHDRNQSGWVQLNYEQFMNLVFSLNMRV